jgi:hypothetical protein
MGPGKSFITTQCLEIHLEHIRAACRRSTTANDRFEYGKAWTAGSGLRVLLVSPLVSLVLPPKPGTMWEHDDILPLKFGDHALPQSVLDSGTWTSIPSDQFRKTHDFTVFQVLNGWGKIKEATVCTFDSALETIVQSHRTLVLEGRALMPTVLCPVPARISRCAWNST